MNFKRTLVTLTFVSCYTLTSCNKENIEEIKTSSQDITKQTIDIKEEQEEDLDDYNNVLGEPEFSEPTEEDIQAKLIGCSRNSHFNVQFYTPKYDGYKYYKVTFWNHVNHKKTRRIDTKIYSESRINTTPRVDRTYKNSRGSKVHELSFRVEAYTADENLAFIKDYTKTILASQCENKRIRIQIKDNSPCTHRGKGIRIKFKHKAFNTRYSNKYLPPSSKNFLGVYLDYKTLTLTASASKTRTVLLEGDSGSYYIRYWSRDHLGNYSENRKRVAHDYNIDDVCLLTKTPDYFATR